MNQQTQVTTGGANQLRPTVTAVTATLPAMTLAEWYRLPAIVRYFHPWERARQPLVIDAQTKRALEPQMGSGITPALSPVGKVPRGSTVLTDHNGKRAVWINGKLYQK